MVSEINRGAPGRSHLFRAEINELGRDPGGGRPPDTLVVESRHSGRGVTRRERE